MYNVAICEDDPVFAQISERICRETLCKLDIKFQIAHFLSGEAFLDVFAEKHYDLILLDIIIGGVDGIELARKIRETDKNVVIIFISGFDYALPSYDVNAFYYFKKPIDEAALSHKISQAYTESLKHEYILIKIGAKNMRISPADIVLLETKGRQVEMTLTDGTIHFNGKLTELLPLLPREQFIRCHQSFAVNINHIRTLTRKNAATGTGKEIPISRTYMNEVRKAFFRCIKEC